MRAACFGVVATVVLSHAVLAEDKSSYALPKPTGQFLVGRTIEWWTDHDRREQATSEDHERELQAIIYYPANGAGKHAAYYPGLTGLGRVPETKLLARHFGSAWAAVEGGLVQSNAYADAPFSKNLGKCPVLVFSPGGSAPVLAYSAQLEELASHGYVVVGLNHPYDTALIIRPDQRFIPFVDQSPQQPGPPSVAGLPGFTHGDFMDIAELGAVVTRTNKSTAQSNLELANHLTLAFFDAMLKHDNDSWRQLVMNPPEGVSIESFGNRHIQ